MGKIIPNRKTFHSSSLSLPGKIGAPLDGFQILRSILKSIPFFRSQRSTARSEGRTKQKRSVNHCSQKLQIALWLHRCAVYGVCVCALAARHRFVTSANRACRHRQRASRSVSVVRFSKLNISIKPVVAAGHRFIIEPLPSGSRLQHCPPVSYPYPEQDMAVHNSHICVCFLPIPISLDACYTHTNTHSLSLTL